MLKTTVTRKFDYDILTVKQLEELLEGAPDHATIRFKESIGDRPYDPTTYTIEVSWDEVK